MGRVNDAEKRQNFKRITKKSRLQLSHAKLLFPPFLVRNKTHESLNFRSPLQVSCSKGSLENNKYFTLSFSLWLMPWKMNDPINTQDFGGTHFEADFKKILFPNCKILSNGLRNNVGKFSTIGTINFYVFQKALCTLILFSECLRIFLKIFSSFLGFVTIIFFYFWILGSSFVILCV